MDDELGCVLTILAVLYLVGTSVAAVLSWSANHSVIWLSLQSFFSWLYVLYYVFFG